MDRSRQSARRAAGRARRRWAIALLGVAWALAGAAGAGAQNVLDVTLDLDFDRSEVWGMKWASSLSLFTGLGVPRAARRGELDLALEVGSVPSLSERERRIGLNGTKVEDINRLEAFGRPRLRAGLSRRLALEASWVPPLTLDGIRPDVAALALDALLLEAERWRLGARLFAAHGTLEGDVTCPAKEVAAGDDLRRNPFRCEQRSRDRITLQTASLALGVASPRGREGRVEPFATLGLSRMDLELQVDARYSGIIDRTRALADGWTAHATLGVGYRISERLSVAGELFYSPLDVVRPPSTRAENDGLLNLRSMLRYGVR